MLLFCREFLKREIIDSPENRKNMPEEDYSGWISADEIAALLLMWVEGKNKPKSGSFVTFKRKDSFVVPEFV